VLQRRHSVGYRYARGSEQAPVAGLPIWLDLTAGDASSLLGSQPDLVGGSSWAEQTTLVQKIEEIISRSDTLIEGSAAK
jgi:hypothetical protein